LLLAIFVVPIVAIVFIAAAIVRRTRRGRQVRRGNTVDNVKDEYFPRSRAESEDDAASFRCDRLPKLDPISFEVGDPAELAEGVAFAFWIDGDAFLYQAIQHSIEVVHLEIDHCFLRRREVCIVWFEKGEDDLRVLGRRGIGEGSVRLQQPEMLLVPLIESLWILRPQKYAAETSD
jgi:hypothetical protein